MIHFAAKEDKIRIINNFLTEISILSHYITKNISLKNTETNKKNYLIFILEKILKLEEKLIELDEVIVTKINSYNVKRDGNYFIDTNTELLKKLYSELEKSDFIDIHKTSQEEFIEVLKSDWDEHNSIIHLKMDSIQFGYFIVNVGIVKTCFPSQIFSFIRNETYFKFNAFTGHSTYVFGNTAKSARNRNWLIQQ